MFRLILCMLVNLALAANAHAAAHELLGMRLSSAPDSSRLVFDISGPVDYRLFRLSGPDRVVIDFSQTRLRAGLTPASDGILRGMTHAPAVICGSCSMCRAGCR